MTSSRPGIGSSPRRQAPGLAVAAHVEDERLYVTLQDGREVSMALPDWVLRAPVEHRSRVQVEDFGTAIYFAGLDEDIGVNELLGISEDELYDFAGWESGDPSESGGD